MHEDSKGISAIPRLVSINASKSSIYKLVIWMHDSTEVCMIMTAMTLYFLLASMRRIVRNCVWLDKIRLLCDIRNILECFRSDRGESTLRAIYMLVEFYASAHLFEENISLNIAGDYAHCFNHFEIFFGTTKITNLFNLNFELFTSSAEW